MRAAQPEVGAMDGEAEVAPTPADFDAAHAELLADTSIQFELRPASQPQQTQRLETEVRIEPQSVSLPAPDAGPLALVIFWIVVALAAAGLLYLIVKRLAGWRKSGSDTGMAESEPEWRIEEAPARQLLGDADALAAEGRYSEAAHLLLHRSIAEIDQRRPASIRKALTSRDIAALPAIPPSPATAFRTIVAAVERSLFAARPLDAGDWQNCRAAYERFAFTKGWQA